MEITKDELIDGSQRIGFFDVSGTHCSISAIGNTMVLQFDLYTNWAEFTQEDVKALVPYLQAFAESGTIESV